MAAGSRILATRRVVVEIRLEASSARQVDVAHEALAEKIRRALPGKTMRLGDGSRVIVRDVSATKVHWPVYQPVPELQKGGRSE